MSAEQRSVRHPEENGCVQSSTTRGTKPLHRFLKGQPKIVGTVVLILGASLFCNNAAVLSSFQRIHMWSTIPPSLLLGAMFIISGSLYILTEYYPTKKTVTISLALSIVSVLGTCWAVLHSLPHFEYYHYLETIEPSDYNTTAIWASYYERVGMTLETVLTFYSFVGGIITVVMSFLAGAALRSTKNQVIVMMVSPPTETAAEYPAQEEELKCIQFKHEL